MTFESPNYYKPTKEGLVKSETIDKIMKPFKDAVNGMTKQEKIDYLCLKTEIDKDEIKRTWGILRDVYMMASKIILEDEEFTKSLTAEEKAKIKNTVDPYVKGQVFEEEYKKESNKISEQGDKKEENEHGESR